MRKYSKYTVFFFAILLSLLCAFSKLPPAWAASDGQINQIQSNAAALADEDSQGARANSSPRSRGNLDNEVLYYIVVDRFFDADPDNNIPDYAFPLTPDLDRYQRAYNEANRLLLPHSFDPTHRYIGLYWGGDLEGVIQKLDYLKDLGATKIILSPIQDNANGLIYSPEKNNYLYQDTNTDNERVDNFYAHALSPFHGYWTKDWFKIDEHFRDPLDESGDQFNVFRQLLDEAGKRDIGIILELTLNHTSPFHYFRLYPDFYPENPGYWYVDNGSVYRNGEKVATYWDPPNSQLDPQGWFHPPLQIDYNRPTQEMIENGMLGGGLPDLNQDMPEVENYLLDAVKFWLNFNEGGYQIAGFSLDAVKHVNIGFWQKLEDTVLSINPSAVLIGEYFSSGYRSEDSVDWYKNTEEYTLFNFNLSMPARRFFARERGWDGRTAILREATLGRKGTYYNYSPVEQFFHWLLDPSGTLEIPRRSLDLVSDDDAKGWINFVENNDEPRLLTASPQMSEEAYASLIKFTFISPGVPMIMYGLETGLAVHYHPEHKGLFGIGGDPFNRQMMIWPDSPGWNSNLYDTTRKMAHLRQNYPVLRYGNTQFLYPRNSKRDEDIFMLRSPVACEATSSNCAQILYAYSTFGGEFLLSLEDEGIHQAEDAQTNITAEVMDGLIPVKLEPEESKVLILER
ncbi:MAG: alpha-amylase family glycosyl hydrolase [Xenococcaceae cyanobacterium]